MKSLLFLYLKILSALFVLILIIPLKLSHAAKNQVKVTATVLPQISFRFDNGNIFISSNVAKGINLYVDGHYLKTIYTSDEMTGLPNKNVLVISCF